MFISIKYWYIAHHYFLSLHCLLPLFWPFKTVYSPHNMGKSSGNTWQSSTVSIEMFSIAHLITVSLLCSRLLIISCDCSLIDIPEPTWKSFFIICLCVCVYVLTHDSWVCFWMETTVGFVLLFSYVYVYAIVYVWNFL